MKVRIYKPAKTAMQSGQGKTKEWLLESEPMPKILDPLMGWTGSRDTMQQVQLWFHTLDEAKAHAEKDGWQYTVEAAAPAAYPAQGLCRQFRLQQSRALDALSAVPEPWSGMWYPADRAPVAQGIRATAF